MLLFKSDMNIDKPAPPPRSTRQAPQCGLGEEEEEDEEEEAQGE